MKTFYSSPKIEITETIDIVTTSAEVETEKVLFKTGDKSSYSSVLSSEDCYDV